MLHRHLGPHRLEHHPGGIEDRAVVGAPEILQLVPGGRRRARQARAEGERFEIPVRRPARRQDRPAHHAEAVGEERRHQLHDVVVRPVPGDECLGAPLLDDPAEAHEGLHLVGVAPDRLLQRREAADVVVHLVVEQVRLAMGLAPEEAVEQGPAPRVRMAGDLAGEVEEAAGDAQWPLRSGIWDGIGVDVEQRQEILILPLDPDGLLRRQTLGEEPAGGGAPSVEIGLDRDPSHSSPVWADWAAVAVGEKSESCSSRAAIFDPRSARSISRASGLWSAVTRNGRAFLSAPELGEIGRVSRRSGGP